MGSLILSIPEKYNGVFQHSFNLALHLSKKDNVSFISHWFNCPLEIITSQKRDS